jgi:hypothetical protein
MPEPSSSTATGLVSLAIALAGASSAAGELGAVIFGALAGALWSLRSGDTPGRFGGALLVAKLVMTAVVLTWVIAWWLHVQYEIPPQHSLGVVAFLIAAVGNRWSAVGGLIFNAGRDVLARLSRGERNTKGRDDER